MKLNINNYVDVNVGSTIVMNNQNKISVNVTDQQAGEVYLDQNKKLKLRLGSLIYTDSSGHFYTRINKDHGLNWKNYKLNLNISQPLSFANKKLTLSYNPYYKVKNNQLDLDIVRYYNIRNGYCEGKK